MACSRPPGALGTDSPRTPPRTPGPLGLGDQGDPSSCAQLGDTPGHLGQGDHADPALQMLGPAAAKAAASPPTPGKRAPWMPFAIAEAEQFKGATEDEIQKTTNFATEVKTGQSSMVGGNHAWCAAFVNWNLQKAGYPIENEGFADHTAAKGRAHAFLEVNKARAKKGEANAPMVRNPLYEQIDKPVYGAIAMVTDRNGHGHHVAFVYSQPSDNTVVLLGGNQSDRIKFSEFNVAAVKPSTVKRNGKDVRLAGHPDHLMFFVPVGYAAYAKSDSGLGTESAEDLNEAHGVVAAKAAAGESTR